MDYSPRVNFLGIPLASKTMKPLLTAFIAFMAFSHSFCKAQAQTTELQDLSYSVGVALAHVMQPAVRASVDPSSYVSGISDTIGKKTPKYSQQQVNQVLSSIDNAADKDARAKMITANKELLSYSMGASIAKAMMLSNKPYDFDLLGQGFTDEFNGAKYRISTQQMTKAFADAQQQAKQALGAH
jgi:hypothetical protein